MRRLGGGYHTAVSLLGAELISRNAEFIHQMIADPVFADMLADDSSHSHHHDTDSLTGDHNHAHHHDTDLQPDSHAEGSRPRISLKHSDDSQDKIRSTLRSFAREWSDEGAEERLQCFGPCLDALERHFPNPTYETEVLVPGCGLGRLPMEIAARGGYGTCSPLRL